jgi:hypothetical protein
MCFCILLLLGTQNGALCCFIFGSV